jgi:anti-sigma factor RsiW
MTEFFCTYGDDRDEALVAFLYDDGDGNEFERARFATHVPACARCQADVAELRGVRAQLAHWAPPAIHNPKSAIQNPRSAIRNSQSWWRDAPAWAQVAAALLFLGVSAGIANLDVRYDGNGLSVRTGWSRRPDGSAAAARSDATPWKTDIAALESQLKNEIRATRTSAAPAVPPAALRPVADGDVNARVRALVADSEKRQQRELALRIAELLRDVNAQRQADLVKIDRTLGVVQNNVGIEVMKNRQQMNQMDLIYRASQRQ